eukprot:SAG22_NODE_4497_length_1250_cov_25.212858_1_plen_180_part_00
MMAASQAPAPSPAGGDWSPTPPRAPPPAYQAAAAVTSVAVTSSRLVEAEWYGRDYTKYLLVASTAGGADAPVTSERRFSEIIAFHETFVAPVMSVDRPVLLPPDTDVLAAAAKNDPDIVAARRVAIQHWANSALELGDRLGSQLYTAALQRFLRGGDTELSPVPGPAIWDPAGEWCVRS